MADGFRATWARPSTNIEDGFTIESPAVARAEVDAIGDHRLAMAFAIAATRANAPVTVSARRRVEVSYPQFFEKLLARVHR